MQLPYGNVPANFAMVALQGELQVERAKLTKEKQALEKLEDKKHIFGRVNSSPTILMSLLFTYHSPLKTIHSNVFAQTFFTCNL